MSRKEPDNNYQVIATGRSYSKTFFQNRIKQAYEAGKEEVFREKDSLIKYLKHKVKIFENRVMEYGFDDDIIKMGCYQDILEKIKSDKYD